MFGYSKLAHHFVGSIFSFFLFYVLPYIIFTPSWCYSLILASWIVVVTRCMEHCLTFVVENISCIMVSVASVLLFLYMCTLGLEFTYWLLKKLQYFWFTLTLTYLLHISNVSLSDMKQEILYYCVMISYICYFLKFLLIFAGLAIFFHM